MQRPVEIELRLAKLLTASRLTADAKPFWSAPYHSLTLTDTEDYEYRRSSIYEISARWIGSRISGKSCGGQGGSRTPDASFFRAGYSQLISLFGQLLNVSRWPQFCDHSVTSADVRLSVGPQCHPCSDPSISPVPGADSWPIRTQLPAYFRFAVTRELFGDLMPCTPLTQRRRYFEGRGDSCRL